MVIDKIRKMSIKGVKLKSESFFSISPGVLELWRKNLRGGGFRPPGPDRVKVSSQSRKFEFNVFSIIHVNDITFDVLNRFQENKVLQTAQIMSNISR